MRLSRENGLSTYFILIPSLNQGRTTEIKLPKVKLMVLYLEQWLEFERMKGI